MLLKPYKNIKDRLSGVTGVKHIDWFNDQYSGIIHTAPAVFIEFPNPLIFETLNETIQQAPLLVRVHTASKVLSEKDKSINELQVETHFAICNEIFKLLQGYRGTDGELLIFNSLLRTQFLHHQYLKNWMISTQDFAGMLYEHGITRDVITRPEAFITVD